MRCSSLVKCCFIRIGIAAIISILLFLSIINHQPEVEEPILPILPIRTINLNSGQRTIIDINVPIVKADNSIPAQSNPAFIMKPFKLDLLKERSAAFQFTEFVDRWSTVTIIKSKCENRNRRDAIRQTWGAIKYLDGVRFEIVFLVGKNGDGFVQTKLTDENKIYGDLLQVNLEDNFYNIIPKTLSGMKWAADNLPSDWLYSSADDDMVLHPVNFARCVEGNLLDLKLRYLTSSSPFTTRKTVEKLPIICMYAFRSSDPPLRKSDVDLNDRLYTISDDEYSLKVWPTYCRGGWYSMPVSTAAKLYKVSTLGNVPHLFLDDVWITGVMRVKMNNEAFTLLGVGSLVQEEGIVAAPLSKRTNDQMIKNELEDDLDAVIVSHVWGGNYSWSSPDPAVEIRKRWIKWQRSVYQRVKFFVKV